MKKKGIPDSANIVHKGKIFQIYEWEQEMYDGSFVTFEKVSRPDTVEVIAVVGDKILLTKQEQPHREHFFLALPGGRVEPEEDALDAAHRELLEETGYDSNDMILWKVFEDTGSVVYTRNIFIARNCERLHDATPDAGEKIEISWLNFDELLLLSENSDFRCKGRLKEEFYYFRLHATGRDEFFELLFKNKYKKILS